MNRVLGNFMAWLQEEAKGLRAIGYIIFAALAVVSLDYTVRAALENWGWIPMPTLQELQANPLEYLSVFYYITTFVWAPVKEEVIFRVLPLSFLITFVTKSPRVVFAILVLMAILFGAIHPYTLDGKFDVAIAGLFLGLVFLKCGGMSQNFVKASICAMAAHGLSNVLTILDAYWNYLEFVK